MYLCLHGWYSCNWICFSIYLSIVYFIWYTTKYTTRCSRVLPNITRSTQLRGTQRSPEIAFKSTDVLVPDILILLALKSVIQCMYSKKMFLYIKTVSNQKVKKVKICKNLKQQILCAIISSREFGCCYKSLKHFTQEYV